MNWLQNSVIVVVCFLMARIVIDAGLHRQWVRGWLRSSRTGAASLITGTMLAAYVLSFFFPNTIVVLSMLPVLKYILETLADKRITRKLSTPLMLALIYGANIGGMASLTGSPLNLVYLGYVELQGLPGREDITFFSWLLFGIPATLVLVLLGRLILRAGSKDFPLGEEVAVGANAGEGGIEPAVSTWKYVVFFLGNILLILVLTALQFFYKPSPVWARLNGIDLFFCLYLLGFLFFAFVFPRGRRTGLKYRKNLVFLLFFVLLFPFLYLLETGRELVARFKLKGRAARVVLKVHGGVTRFFEKIWRWRFREDGVELEERNPHAFVSLNRLIYDLPFLGLLFMGLVLAGVFVLLKIGDNPATSAVDGYVYRFFQQMAGVVVPRGGEGFLFLGGVVLICIFVTEVVNNTTVVIIMFPLVLQVCVSGGLEPLFYLLMVSTAASGAFMTPVATPVNAICYAGVGGVSLKRMLGLGFILNLLSGLWLMLFFHFVLV